MDYFTNDSFASELNATEEIQIESSLTLHPATRVVCGIILTLVVVFGVFGNGLVIAVLRKELKAKMIITYLLITHLCAADIIGCVLDMPLLFAQFVFNIEGHLLHVVSDLNFVVCSAVNLLNCMIINLMSLSRRDAFNILKDPVLTVTRLKIILPIMWTTCIGTSVTLGLSAVLTGRRQWYLQSLTTNKNLGTSILDIGSGSASVFLVLGTFISMIISFGFSLRYIKAHNSMLKQTMIQSRLDLERKMILSALILSTAFLLCWLPWLIVRLLHLVTAEGQSDIAAIVTVVIGLNHCVNPLVYAGTIGELRVKMTEYLKICLKWPRGCLRNVSITDTVKRFNKRKSRHIQPFSSTSLESKGVSHQDYDFKIKTMVQEETKDKQ